MTNRSVLYEFNVDLSTGEWGVSVPRDQSLIGPVQYGWDRFQKDPDSLTFGGGLLAGSPLPGTRRMIFCGYSPQWEDFYVSALGGAMYVFHRLGVNYVWLRGQCPTDSILLLRLKDGQYSARLEPIDPDASGKPTPMPTVARGKVFTRCSSTPLKNIAASTTKTVSAFWPPVPARVTPKKARSDRIRSARAR